MKLSLLRNSGIFWFSWINCRQFFIVMGMEPKILYEDNHVIAVNKPAGLLTQSDKSGDPSLLDELKAYIKKRDKKQGNVFLGMVHRLDRPVSGVILFAKTSKAASRISEQIRLRRFEKLYAAVSELGSEICAGYREWTEMSANLLRIKDKTVVSRYSGSRTQRGVLSIKTLCVGKRHGFHLVRLVTGRKHQIRAQLSHAGWPVYGDRKYGSKKNYPRTGGIGLHSYYCGVKHPVRQDKIGISACLPGAMQKCFSADELTTIMVGLDCELDILQT